MRNPRATAFGGRSAFRRRTHASPTSSETKTPPKYHLKTHEENRKTFALRTGGSRAGLLLYRQGGKPGLRIPRSAGFGIRHSARLDPDERLLVLDIEQHLEGGRRQGPRVDEKGRYQPGVHRQHRSGRRTLRQRQDAQRRMVGRSPHRTEKSDRTGHRDRHIQLPRLEPVGRPVGKTRTGDALSGLVGNPSKRSPEGQPQTR